MPFTIDDTGVTIQDLNEKIDELETELRDPSNFGPDFSLDPTTPIPMFTRILAAELVAMQAKLKAAVDALTPGSARGVHADNIGALTNTTRYSATYSTVPVTFTGAADETIPTGRQFQHTATGTLWNSTEAVVLDGGGSGTTTLTADETGPIDAVAGAGWTIVLGDGNLTSILSTADSTPGRNQETDSAYEARRRATVSLIGTSTLGAVESQLTNALSLLGASSVRVYHNPTGATDAAGRPPKSYEVVVDDGGLLSNDDIAQEIFRVGPAGILTYGAESGTATDSEGSTHTISFTRVAALEVHHRITVTTTGAEQSVVNPSSLTSVIKAAVVDFGNSLAAGSNVVPARFAAVAFGEVPEGQAVSVTAEQSLDGVGWSSGVLAVTDYQQSDHDTTRVTVVYA
ncbi:MAG: hypothetical protein B7733_24650 [Myxococcales bacterium FL481]|nr:MAG: hypothetical protein B7733_24650 [Myxococcales bacterium FL481]